jgi:hypothetical protein
LSTGPTSAAGKAMVAMNGYKHKKGALSVRERRALTADLRGLVAGMARLRARGRRQAADQKRDALRHPAPRASDPSVQRG